MRDLHSRMLAALLAGEGLRAVAELAAAEAGAPVAIVVPARGLAAASSKAIDLARMEGYAGGLARGEPTPKPKELELTVPVLEGEATIGFALGFTPARNGRPAVDRREVLRTAALATLTEIAVADARDEVVGAVRGSLLEELRSGAAESGDAVRRAARLGCDLRAGAVALVAEVRSARPHHAAGLIVGEYAGAVAEPLPVDREGAPGATRVYALLPARGTDDAPERTAAAARELAGRLRAHGPTAFSSFCAAPAELGRAIAEAELMLEVIAADDRMAEQLADGISNSVYRLLFRAMATDPEEVRRFYAETVESLVNHDRRYRTDLLETLEAYLANDCNMNATARAVYAHRHTVAHRLARIRELSGLDPARGEDRERLGLGIKAHRILAPTLPR